MPQQTQIELNEAALNTPSFQVAEDVLYRQVENEAILLHIPDGAYYSLNETSILFWEALEAQKPFAPVIEQILAEYAVDRSTVLQDLEAFLQELTDLGLIAHASNEAISK